MIETNQRWAAPLQRKAERYAREAFDIGLALRSLSAPSLPTNIAECYRFWRGDIFGRLCVFMAAPTVEDASGLGELVRHRQLVQEQWPGEPVILIFEGLAPRRRKRLIAGRLGFMVPGAQLFIPELLLDFRESRLAKTSIMPAPERFSSAAQRIVLAALLHQEIDGANATWLARRFGVAIMTISRALDELEAVGVADAGRVGRERTLHMRAKGQALWCKVERYLKSPVRKLCRVVIPHPERFPGLVAGESALAFYTPLSAPRIPTLAVAGTDWNRLVREHGLQEVERSQSNGCDIQTWAYDPTAQAESKVVDRLSLYLSVRDLNDEGVARAAEDLLEGMPW